MNKLRAAALALLGAVLAGCATPAVVFISPAYDPGKVRRVAVASFDDFPSSPGSGEIASTFEKYLLWGGYSVIERRQVSQVLQEQSLSATGALDPSTIRSIGKVLGVDALAFGNLSDYTSASQQTVMVDEPQEQSDPVYGQVVTVQRNGGNVTKNVQNVVTGYNTTVTDQSVPETESFPAHVGMSVRLVDAETGELLWSASAADDGVDLSAAAEQASSDLMQGVVKQLKAAAKPSK